MPKTRTFFLKYQFVGIDSSVMLTRRLRFIIGMNDLL